VSLILRPFTFSDETAAREAHDTFAKSGLTFLQRFDPSMSWARWLRNIEDLSQGREVPRDAVRGAFLAAEVEGELVGRLAVRFELNSYLELRGGHIGYAVIPTFRRRGYATAMLREGLRMAHDGGVDPVLVVCDDDNVASATVIERCGGVLEGIVEVDDQPLRRYWFSHSS
jgi:predicted acetyltransferase